MIARNLLLVTQATRKQIAFRDKLVLHSNVVPQSEVRREDDAAVALMDATTAINIAWLVRLSREFWFRFAIVDVRFDFGELLAEVFKKNFLLALDHLVILDSLVCDFLEDFLATASFVLNYFTVVIFFKRFNNNHAFILKLVVVVGLNFFCLLSEERVSEKSLKSEEIRK